MPKVTFAPMNMIVDAKNGESLLDIALNHNVPMQHACGGFCSCTTCHVVVKSGAENLSTIEEDEADRMENLDGRVQASRLGCQAKVKGDVTVEIQNIDTY